jgi:hypothetical protein
VRHGIHAGAVETAMMLAVRPDLVRMELAEDFVPATVGHEREFPRLRALGAAGFGWQMQDMHPKGGGGGCEGGDGGGGEGGAGVCGGVCGGVGGGGGAVPVDVARLGGLDPYMCGLTIRLGAFYGRTRLPRSLARFFLYEEHYSIPTLKPAGNTSR